MLQQSGASHLHKRAESQQSEGGEGRLIKNSEGLFNAVAQALICFITEEVLVVATVIFCIYYWYFVISWNLIGRGTQIY